jgi:hypothetical protein
LTTGTFQFLDAHADVRILEKHYHGGGSAVRTEHVGSCMSVTVGHNIEDDLVITGPWGCVAGPWGLCGQNQGKLPQITEGHVNTPPGSPAPYSNDQADGCMHNSIVFEDPWASTPVKSCKHITISSDHTFTHTVLKHSHMSQPLSSPLHCFMSLVDQPHSCKHHVQLQQVHYAVLYRTGTALYRTVPCSTYQHAQHCMQYKCLLSCLQASDTQ